MFPSFFPFFFPLLVGLEFVGYEEIPERYFNETG